jgi:hypothetical protein
MDPDKPAKRAVVTTLTAALAEIERWLAENGLDALRDADGLTWRLSAQVDQIADPADPKGMLWRLRLAPTVEVDAATLVATGTLAAVADQRLVELLGEDTVTLAMKPVSHTAANAEALRLLAADVVPRFRSEFAGRALHEVKRVLVGRHIDERGIFGLRG